jgi:hypothetical protein
MATINDLALIWRKRQEFTGTDHPGLRLNNLTTTQRDALTGAGAAKVGDVIWNTTTSAIEYYGGSAWSGVPVSVTEAELGVIDGVVAGTVTASKALVVDSNKDLATLRHLTISGNLVTGATTLSEAELGVLDSASSTPTASKAVVATASGWQAIRRPVVEDGASVVLSAADSGALCIFDKVDGALFTLPTPAIGLYFEFIAVASVTSNSYKVITNTGTVFIIGSVDMVDTDSTFTHTNQDANGSTHVSVTMASASTNANGGIKGTRFMLTCRTATTWAVHGQIHHAGSVATPFAVS